MRVECQHCGRFRARRRLVWRERWAGCRILECAAEGPCTAAYYAHDYHPASPEARRAQAEWEGLRRHA